MSVEPKQQRRVEEYMSWDGAESVKTKAAATHGRSAAAVKMAQEELKVIRSVLGADTPPSKVVLDVQDERVKDLIRKELTPEESKKVAFADED